MDIKHTKESKNNIFSNFWKWFEQNSSKFFTFVKNDKNVHEEFFPDLDHHLEQIKEGFYYSVGMYDDHTAELIISADGNINNIAFIEELVSAAPILKNWRFTALKQPSENADFSIKMNEYIFNTNNMYFYVNDNDYFPDEIDLTIVHKDMTEENISQLRPGICIYIENFIGELTFANSIDNLRFEGPQNNSKNEAIPIEKLKDYIRWREKEFIEKYEGTWYDVESDAYSFFEGELENGNPSLAVINTDLLAWDSKASHPWIAILIIGYDQDLENGLPSDEDMEMLEIIEDALMEKLVSKEGNIYLGRETASYEREIFFVCKDFRKVSKEFYIVQQIHGTYFDITYDIYKDKYWQSFERFM